MTDALDRAVDARIDAYRPDTVPPFETVQARKRARDRRHGTAAVAAVAVAVGATAFAPSVLGLGDDRGNSPTTVANGPGATVFEYRAQPDDVAAFRAAGGNARADLEVCMLHPGVSGGVKLSDPPVYEGQVAGGGEAEAFRACVESVPGMAVTLTPVEEPPDGAPIVWTGAEICLVGSKAPCRHADAEQAALLDRALARAVPAPDDTVYCAAMTPSYLVLFQHPAVKPVPIEVPRGCGPVMKGDQPYLLDGPGREQVHDAFTRAAGSAISPAGLTAQQQRFIEQCLSGDTPLPAPGFVGRTEAEATYANEDDVTWRVIGRDNRCLDRTPDAHEDRVNLILDDGIVIWAGRF